MKLFPILLAVFVSCLNCYSQANIYHSFPDSGAIWTTADYVPGCLVNPCDYEYYVIGSDTFVHDKNYHKLLKGYITFGPNGPNYTPPYFSYMLIREDTVNRKIYYGDVTVDQDKLLYDFNLNEGDTLPDGVVSSKNYGVYVTKIDSIMLLDGSYRKQFKLNSIHVEGNDTLSLIEGIGYTGGFFRSIMQMVGFEGSSDLACFFDGESFKYHYDYFDIENCSLPSGIGATIEQHFFPIFPNPTSTTITLSLPSNQDAILSIFNLLGEKVKEEKVTGKQVSMDVSSLPQGLYLVRTENRVVGKFVKE